MTGSPEISVVIPVRNGMPYIAEAIESVLAEGPLIAEVIVVDDASDDGTRAAVAAMAAPRIRLSSNPGRGVSSARNSGIAQARADWVLFLDADDRVAPGGVAGLLQQARAASVAVYGDYDRIDAAGHRTGLRHLVRGRRQKPSGAILDAIVTANFIAVGCVLIRREALVAIGGFDRTLDLCEDWLLWCRLATLGPIDYVRGVHVCDYRIHSTSTMHRAARSFADFAMVLDRIFDDPLVRAGLDPAKIGPFRIRAEQSLRSYVALEAVRLGAWPVAVDAFVAAARRFPSSIPRLTMRLAASMAGM